MFKKIIFLFLFMSLNFLHLKSGDDELLVPADFNIEEVTPQEAEQEIQNLEQEGAEIQDIEINDDDSDISDMEIDIDPIDPVIEPDPNGMPLSEKLALACAYLKFRASQVKKITYAGVLLAVVAVSAGSVILYKKYTK